MKNKRLKILVLSVWYPSAVSPSYGVFVKEFARAISFFADTVVLNVIPVDDKNYKLLGLHDTQEDGVRVIRIYFKNVLLFRKVIGFYKFLKGINYLKENRFKPDLVNAQVYYSALPAILSKYTRNVPLTVTEHSTDFLNARGLGYLSGKMYNWVAKKAKLIMPVSQYLLKSMQSYSRAVYKVVPNVFDPKVFYYKKENTIKKEKRLIFVGSLIQRKGIDFLLEVFSEIKSQNIFLTIVGEGSERDIYKHLARNLDIEKRVTFCGQKNHKQIADLMRKSDLYVHSSRSETFGCVLMEAMACGLPVVATRVGGVPEVVDKNSGILVDFGDVAAFKEAILKVLTNSGKFNRAQIAARTYDRFSNRKAGEKLSNILRKLIF